MSILTTTNTLKNKQQLSPKSNNITVPTQNFFLTGTLIILLVKVKYDRTFCVSHNLNITAPLP